jgi:hypothetical protein
MWLQGKLIYNNFPCTGFKGLKPNVDTDLEEGSNLPSGFWCKGESVCTISSWLKGERVSR